MDKFQKNHLATVHIHMNIMGRDTKDVSGGEPTLEEMILGAQRFLRWHLQQVKVGEKLLKNLIAQREPKIASREEVKDVYAEGVKVGMDIGKALSEGASIEP